MKRMLLVAGIALAGCGGASNRTSSSTSYTDDQVAQRLHLVDVPNGVPGEMKLPTASGALSYGTCDALVVLGTSGLKAYLGDSWVVTNPSKTAGVKVDQGLPQCMARFKAALAKLR